jgi:tryptophanyl-tRNA synthetase
MDKKVLYSATKPTGTLTLGNYLGAIQNWVNLQKDYNCYFAIANLHALTIDIDSKELYDNTIKQLAMFLAVGLDPKVSTIYLQSQVSEHAELGWVMSCYTPFGQGCRMTQFKAKKDESENVSAGLYSYPMLMAGDILLYNSDIVPVGKDQLQHLELARDIALRMNNKFNNLFVMPEGYVSKEGTKIMDLQDPTKKMSKSEGDNFGVIFLTDSQDVILKKIKRAVTDSDNLIKYDTKNKPGVSNLLTIFAKLNNMSINDAEKHFSGLSYGELKNQTASSIINLLTPIQQKYNELLKDPQNLINIARNGADKARVVAKETMDRVYKALGIIR